MSRVFKRAPIFSVGLFVHKVFYTTSDTNMLYHGTPNTKPSTLNAKLHSNTASRRLTFLEDWGLRIRSVRFTVYSFQLWGFVSNL